MIDERIRIQENYDMTMETAIDEAREEGLEQGIEKGIEKAQLQSIHNLMASMKWTVKQAMDALGIPEDERNKYIDGLKQK